MIKKQNSESLKDQRRGAKSIDAIKERLEHNAVERGDKDRRKERRMESDQYQQVIVKRIDETFRHPDDILQLAIHEGKSQIERPKLSLLLSSIAAGMIIGFTVLAVAVMASILGDLEGINRVLVALVYPLGFVLCILSRTQLFTEHTATAVYPLLDGAASGIGVLKLWSIVILGNLSGGFIIALLLSSAESVIHAREGYLLVANHVLAYEAGSLFVSAILAGWLMAIGAWTILSTHSTPGQILCIYVVTFLIGIGGLHHSIAGSVELFVGYLMSPTISLSMIFPVIGIILLGNAIGGSIFVALLNYGHIRGLNK
ncbi:formate/nitrite transporter family protein [Thalassotalea piscium]|uniref:Formate/nitrite transporter FocA (FNT family) n=1 Tax=Thalassotalea piscium TaxID=1230533 RepID=A0A7X0TUM8_9GAMM|nr:formate/nitrite transporter family protein [Thalassotalea piscium]MBB6544547.1 formate/nitrite transporter FocA (FNT family) [Thalassotalea piscium]